MSFKQITPYKLKHIIPIFGLIGCGLTTSCEKNEPLTVPQRSIQLILPGGTNSIYNDGNQEFMDMVYSIGFLIHWQEFFRSFFCADINTKISGNL